MMNINEERTKKKKEHLSFQNDNPRAVEILTYVNFPTDGILYIPRCYN